MQRLIDANVFKKDLKFLEQDCRNCGQISCAEEIKLITEILDEQPTIEAEPVAHGHWERVDVKPELRHLVCGNSRCSVCGKFGFDHFLRCGYCGAKMDEEQG